MKVYKNGIRSIFERAVSLAALCFCAGYLVISPVNAATKPAFNLVPLNQSGNTARIGSPGSSPAAFPNVGNITPQSGSGWYQAGNYGVAPAASGTTMYMGITGEAVFAGTKYPWQAAYQVPKSSLYSAAQGIATVAAAASGGLPAVAAAVLFTTSPFLLDWLTKAGGRVAPDGSTLQLRDLTTCPTASACTVYRTRTWDNAAFQTRTESTNRDASCDFTVSEVRARAINQYPSSVTVTNYTNCSFNSTGQGSTGIPYNISYTGWGYGTATVTRPPSYLPKSMDDIAPYMARSDVNPDGRVVAEILDKGGDLTMPSPTVTGPASVSGPESTTVNPDGTKRVEKTTYNFNTSGDTITNTSNVTTVTIKDSNNVTTAVTTTTTTPVNEQEQQSECEKNPDTLGCKKLDDVPTTEVPKKTETVTWAEENLGFGNGSCPAPFTFNTSNGNYSLDLAQYCTTLSTYVKPVVIALALLAAFFIVAPVKSGV